MSNAQRVRPNWRETGVAVIFVIAGLCLAVPGLYLLSLGGSFYYVLAGILATLCGVLLYQRRASSVALYWLLLVGTIIWSLWESGFNGWALIPRLDIVLVLGVLLWLARIGSDPSKRRTGVAARAVAAVVVVVAVGAGGFALLARGEAYAADAQIASVVPTARADGDWAHVGRTDGADRFSPLQQITPANVSGLEQVWSVRMGFVPNGRPGALEGTPLKVGDTLYACNMTGEVFAVDPDTGAVRWRYNPKVDPAVLNMAICRGVTYYKSPDASAPCPERIIATIYDGRLAALDARTGKLCPSFGKGGEVSLLEGLGTPDRGYYYITSPAAMVRGKVVVGGSVLDGQKVEEPSGVIRAYDAMTGELAWAWDMGRPGKRGLPGPGETYTPGTPNAWAPLSGDEKLGLVFVPLGNPTPDYVTTHRTPEMIKYGSSLVALDIATGEPRWHYQTVHMDVWDYDIPTAPTSIDFPTPKGNRPALIVPTKRGEFFILDRETGKPLVETVEKRVPQGAAPGERLASTQPYPVGMPSFGGGRLTEAHMWGLTPYDQLWCRIKYRQARYEGDFTPIGVDRPSIVYPGYLGGAEWGGVSVDPERKILVLNVNHFPMYNQLKRRADVDFKPMVTGRDFYDASRTTQAGTPYAAVIKAFLSPLNVPCHQPPYSEVATVDLKTRKIVWQKPLGTARDSGAFGLKSMLPFDMGVPAMGGTITTRSGLIFIAATQERSFRAFDLKSGRKLWETRLPAGGHATPMTYYSDKSGRQYVVIMASGHPLMSPDLGDYMIAYALPKKK